jgi:hypothetical protein
MALRGWGDAAAIAAFAAVAASVLALAWLTLV